MFKRLVIVFTAFFAICLSVPSMAAGLFGHQSVPVQSYQESPHLVSKHQQTAESASQNKVQKVDSKSASTKGTENENEQQNLQSQAQIIAEQQQQISKQQQEIQTLRKAMIQMNQMENEFQKSAQKQFLGMQHKNEILQKQMDQLTQVVASLNEQLKQSVISNSPADSHAVSEKPETVVAQSSEFEKMLMVFHENVGTTVFLSGVALISILLMLVLVKLLNRQSKLEEKKES